jgi:hypothetical protein
MGLYGFLTMPLPSHTMASTCQIESLMCCCLFSCVRWRQSALCVLLTEYEHAPVCAC